MTRGDAGADHDGRWRRQTERTRAGDDEHRDRMQHGRRDRRAGEQPADAGDDRDDDDNRHEHGAHLIDDALDRRLLRLRRFDEAHDARQLRLGTNGRRAQQQRAFPVHGAAGQSVPRRARDGQALAGEQRFVDMGAAFEQLAVYRDALAGTHDNLVADAYLGDRHFALDAVAPDARNIRAKRLQRPDRVGRLPLRARLEPLAEQHERDDDRRRFEIERWHRFVGGQQREDAQAERGAGAKRDEQVHVAAAGAQRGPAGAVEACPEPELYRRGEQQLQPAGEHPVAAEHVADHRQHEWRRQQRGERDTRSLAEPRLRLRRAHRGGAVLVRGVAGSLDRADQFGRARAACKKRHARPLGREIDFGLRHPRHLRERLFDAADAARAGHAFDCERDAVARHAISGALDGFDELAGVELALGVDARPLGREVDRRGVDARDARERLLDACDATRTRHAGDRQRKRRLKGAGGGSHEGE